LNALWKNKREVLMDEVSCNLDKIDIETYDPFEPWSNEDINWSFDLKENG
jgi:hypothetical protein